MPPAEMSSARVNYVYKSDVSESIRLQIQQLHLQEARIVELEAELSQLRKAHGELERDLAPYRIESPFANITSTQRIPLELCQVEAAPIHRFPDEILCLVFKKYIFMQSNGPCIRRLLLVCRRWYMLVTYTAKLWARIEIRSALDLFDIGARKSLFPYIFACLDRSKNLPITVDLQMDNLGHEYYIAEALVQQAKAIVDEDERDMIVDRIESQEWDFRSTWFDSQLEPVIERLVGADGEHIKRWETMTLYLPDDEDMAIRVWNILARGLKAVKNVVLDNFPSASPHIFVPDFGTVKKFDLTYACDAERRPITRFGLSPSTLGHLEIRVRNPSIDLAELPRFQQLHTLRLSCPSSGKKENLDFSISLPHLETLTLWGNYGILAQLRFNFPSLDLLTVTWEKNAQLPAVHPRHIQASLSFKLSRIQLKKVIQDCILLSNALECITINHPLERDDVNEVVAQSKLEGMAPSLTQIIIEHRNGEVERIRV